LYISRIITYIIYNQVEDDTGHVFLADFGLGRLLTKTRVFGTATKIAGTPGFQAPEKLRGEKITTLVDIYAVGGILVDLFGGKPLYNMDPHTIMFQVGVRNVFPDISHIPPKIQQILEKCLCSVECRHSSLKLLELFLDL
jgi:serine/threonine protein kinase